MRKPQAYAPTTAAQHRSQIVKLLHANSRSRNLWDVFSDFVEMGALAFANKVDLAQFDERENRYLRIVKRYSPEEVSRFCEMLAHLTNAMHLGPDDVLGKVFSELELGNSARGQFFTPYEVCRLMAQMKFRDADELQQVINQRGYVTVHEPACGAGAMIIAMADTFHHMGINYQQNLHVVAQDVDSRAVHMAYLQLTLMHVPAIIILGNTLTLEQREVWYTPAHVLGNWKRKLSQGYLEGSELDPANLRKSTSEDLIEQMGLLFPTEAEVCEELPMLDAYGT